MKLPLSVVAQAVHGQLMGPDVDIGDVSIDTRNLAPGNLYVAIKGQHFDGHDFIDQAQMAGAGALLVSKLTASNLPQVLVVDTRRALAELAGFWRQQLPVSLVGVTGSNGKTTVKEMIAAIFSAQGSTLATKGNLNNDIGVPLTLLKLNSAHRYAVIEMGANHPGEIAYTSQYARAAVSVITNVGPAHIEGFGSIDGVARTKGEIIESLAVDGVAVLNRDDVFYPFWQELAGVRQTVSFGFDPKADVRAANIESRLLPQGFVSRFDLLSQGESIRVALGLAGEHNIRNALAAAAVTQQFGIDLASIKEALESVKPVTGRMQALLGLKGNVVIDDTYNANPASLQAALDSLAGGHDEIWLVLGAFGELGPDSQAMHRQMGRMIRSKSIKRLFAIGTDARQTVQAFGEGGEFFVNQEQMIEALHKGMTGKETILVKGSRSQKMENVVAALVNNFRAA